MQPDPPSSAAGGNVGLVLSPSGPLGLNCDVRLAAVRRTARLCEPRLRSGFKALLRARSASKCHTCLRCVLGFETASKQHFSHNAPLAPGPFLEPGHLRALVAHLLLPAANVLQAVQALLA